MQSGLARANPSLPGKGETLVDRKTGLMWQKGDSYLDVKKGLNWYEALEYVEEKNAEKFGGYSDWRLPTMEELDKLWDSSRPLKSKDGEPIGLSPDFKGGGSYYLWTGDERGLDNAWYFGLGHKEHYFNLKDLGDLDQGVKMVRNPRDAKG
ncbi:MAG: DUF1566 domain-containing protein [Nitrospinaceae bacterium]